MIIDHETEACGATANLEEMRKGTSQTNRKSIGPSRKVILDIE